MGRSGRSLLADERVEEGAPLGVVGLGKLEDDGNMGFDIHCLQNNSRGRRDDRSGGVGLAIDGRSGGRRVGVVEVGVEKRVDIHGAEIATRTTEEGAAELGSGRKCSRRR